MASRTVNQSPGYYFQLRSFTGTAMLTMFTIILLTAFLMPFAYGFMTAFKDRDQIVAGANGSILPVDTIQFEYEGTDYDVFYVPTDGGTQEWALVRGGRNDSSFVDPANPEAGLIEWEGRWRTLSPVTEFSPRYDNFATAWNGINFPRLLFNTSAIAFIGMFGTLVSSIAVAYGFARFPIPGKSIIFLVLVGTIILPRQVTLVPTYAFFSLLGWTGTWLPLLVPHFFANAYNVFLLRQYFLSLPRELDEAAMIDGAGPLRILVSVIVPQSYPVIIAVALFHFVFAWNDYFEPLIYLLGRPELQPIAVGIQQYNFLYDQQPHLIQATSLMGLVLPLIIFFLAQRFFMQGVVITGVDK